MRKTVDKKACKEFADPELKFNLDSGVLYLENITYIIRTAIKNIAGSRTLILYLYDREKLLAMDWKPVITVFQISTDHQTLVREESGERKWHSAMLSRLISDGYYTKKLSAFYSLKDQKRVFSFCGKHGTSGEDALEHYQEKILNARTKKRVKKRELAIKRVMDTVPKLARKEQKWLDDSLIQKYIFYTYQRRKPPTDAFCTACGQTVELASAKHNQAGVCPHCGKRVVFKAKGRQSKIWDRSTAQIISRISDSRLVLRIVKCEQYISKNCIQKDFRESARFFLDFSEGKLQIEPYYNSYCKGIVTSWKNGFRPKFSSYQYSFEGDNIGVLYTGNLPSALIGSPWQYSQIESFADHWGPMEVIDYFYAYKNHPELEYLVKLKLYRLAGVVIRGGEYSVRRFLHLKERSLEKILGVPKQYLPLLQKLDVDDFSLGVVQCVLKAGYVRDLEETVVWVKENEVNDLDCLQKALTYTTPHRWMKYVTEQAKKRPKETRYFMRRDFDDRVQRTATEYRDYLQMCEKCKIDLSSEFNLFPFDLQRRHDELIAMQEAKKVEKLNASIRALFPELEKRFGFRKDGFKIVPPNKATAISDEGAMLHHCVGSYVDRMAEGKTVILFIRQEQEPDKPFFTMEVQNNKVVQLRGFQNSTPPEDVKKFVEVWKKQVLNAPVKTEQQKAKPALKAA